MDFGRVEHPHLIDFALPEDHPDTKDVLSDRRQREGLDIYVGCAKWNRNELKHFYPKGIVDDLAYYSGQFNSIELNTAFYNIYGREQIQKWRDKTPENFRFSPKIFRGISHDSALQGVESLLDQYCESIRSFESRLGMVFLQLSESFDPSKFERLERFLTLFPKDLPLAVELRHRDWFRDKEIYNRFYNRFRESDVTHVIVDTVGRRDMVHMRLSTPSVFIRWVGSNHDSDYSRLDEWVIRLKSWFESGLRNLYFFVHQNTEEESPRLAAYFIERLNAECGTNLKIPDLPPEQQLLF